MLEKKKIILYYFSGTGNTLLVARKIQETFQSQAYEVELRKIIKVIQEREVDLPDDCHIGIVVPVALQSTFPIVWDFVEKLPSGKNRKIFLADTMEAYSGGIVGPMKKILQKKGYQCIGACEFKMASSMQKSSQKIENDKKKNKEALPQAEAYVYALISEKTKWKRIPILSDAMRSISKGKLIWIKNSEGIHTEDDLCIQCKLCEKNCPMQAIHFENNHMIINHKICISCMRCANYCPKHAIMLGKKPIIQKKVVQINEL